MSLTLTCWAHAAGQVEPDSDLNWTDLLTKLCFINNKGERCSAAAPIVGASIDLMLYGRQAAAVKPDHMIRSGTTSDVQSAGSVGCPLSLSSSAGMNDYLIPSSAVVDYWLESC